MENTKQALDKGYIGYGIFVNLQKAFDTVDQEIHLIMGLIKFFYGICGISNDWFKPHLSNQQSYVSINVHQSGLTKINCFVAQGCLFFVTAILTVPRPTLGHY